MSEDKDGVPQWYLMQIISLDSVNEVYLYFQGIFLFM